MTKQLIRSSERSSSAVTAIVSVALAAAVVLLLPNLAFGQDVTFQACGYTAARAKGATTDWQLLFFRIFASLSVMGAVATVTRKNPVVAAVCLVATLFSVGGVFLLLNATFLAAMQILVYAGAIMVLFMFVVMAVGRPDEEEFGFGRGLVTKVVGILAIIVIVAPLLTQLKKTGLKLNPLPSEQFGTVEEIGRLLFSDYLFPFEAISVLLLVAIVGAVMVTSKRRNQEDSEAKR